MNTYYVLVPIRKSDNYWGDHDFCGFTNNPVIIDRFFDQFNDTITKTSLMKQFDVYQVDLSDDDEIKEYIQHKILHEYAGYPLVSDIMNNIEPLEYIESDVWDGVYTVSTDYAILQTESMYDGGVLDGLLSETLISLLSVLKIAPYMLDKDYIKKLGSLFIQQIVFLVAYLSNIDLNTISEKWWTIIQSFEQPVSINNPYSENPCYLCGQYTSMPDCIDIFSLIDPICYYRICMEDYLFSDDAYYI